MQTQGGSEAEELIAGSAERRFRISIQVDWERDGTIMFPLGDLGGEYLDSFSISRALQGSAPEEILLIEGAAAAELTFVCSGEYQGMPLAAVFSPYNGNSPFYLWDLIGCEVKVWIGVDLSTGVLWYQQFVGMIRTISPDRATGAVTFTALDWVELLRKPILFAPWAVSEHLGPYGNLLYAQNNQRISSTWVIDNCLRLCDVSPSPYRPEFREEMNVPDNSLDGTLFYLTANDGWLPTLGFVDNVDVQQMQWDTSSFGGVYRAGGPTHSLVSTGNTTPPKGYYTAFDDDWVQNRYWVSNRQRMNRTSTHYLGLTLLIGDDQDDLWWFGSDREIYRVHLGEWEVLQIWIGDSGKIWTRYANYDTAQFRESTRLTIPTTGTSQRVAVVWDLSDTSGIRSYIRCGTANSGTWVSHADLSAPSTELDELKGLIHINRWTSMADIVYKARNIHSAPTTNEVARLAKYAAVLDYGKNRMSYIPRRAEDAWRTITAVAAAEMGSVFWDETGIFRFWTYDTLKAKHIATPSRIMTLDHLSGLNMEWSSDSVRNIWTVESARRRSLITTIYEGRDPAEFTVNPNELKEFRIYVEDAQCISPWKMTRYRSSADAPGTGAPIWDSSTDATVIHGFIPEWFNSAEFPGVWHEHNRGLSYDVICWYTETGEFIMRVWNGWAEPMRFLRTRIIGSKILVSDTVASSTKEPNSIAKFGARNLQLSGDWHQSSHYIDTVATDLIERTAKPIPTTQNIEIPGDPRIQLGDVIAAKDPDGFGEMVRMQVYGYVRSWNGPNTGLTDNLTVELIHSPGVGVWDSAQYGRWDTTFVWGP